MCIQLLLLCLFSTDDKDWVRAPGSFIYSIRNNDGLAPFKFTLKDESSKYAIRGYKIRGLIFGNGPDLLIHHNAGISNKSYTEFGYTYNLTWLHYWPSQYRIPAWRELTLPTIRSGSTLLKLKLCSHILPLKVISLNKNSRYTVYDVINAYPLLKPGL